MVIDDNFKPFTVGDWQSRQHRPASAIKKEEDKIEYEKNYPTFRQGLTVETFRPIFQRCEETCTELDRLMRMGSREVADEAQYAINAYGRAMQLAAELLELKAKLRGR